MNRVIASTPESKERHMGVIHFYCVKCRDHFKSDLYEYIKFKNGKDAVKCKCEKCATMSYLIRKKEN